MTENDPRERFLRLREALRGQLVLYDDQVSSLREEVARTLKRREEVEVAMSRVDTLIADFDVVSQFEAGTLAISSVVDALRERSSETDASSVLIQLEVQSLESGPSEKDGSIFGALGAVIEGTGTIRLVKPGANAKQRDLIDFVLDVEFEEHGHESPRTGLFARDVSRMVNQYFGVDLPGKAAARHLSKLVNHEPHANMEYEGGRYWRRARIAERPTKGGSRNDRKKRDSK